MLLDDGARFVRGLRSLKTPPQTAAGVEAALRRAMAQRGEHFLEMLDVAVWPHPRSPSRQLLVAAGVEARDVVAMVRQDGLEASLSRLRDLGVYVAYEEWQGAQPARRGSTTLHFEPTDFFNPAIIPDFIGMSGGSRSGGTPVAGTFTQLKAEGGLIAGVYVVRDVLRAPAALWFPVMPSTAGLATMLYSVAAGNPPQAWFTQVDPREVSVSGRKQLVNRALPYVGRLAGLRLPHPVVVPPTDPSLVLRWVERALAAGGRAVLGSYASSGLQLCRVAMESGTRLDGLVLLMTGEPLTPARAEEIRASGAEASDIYGATQLGPAGLSCPHLPDEVLHLAEPTLAVTSRMRRSPDGEEVDALLWTTLHPASGNVLLNVENDDVAALSVDTEPCGCFWGRIGVRQRLGRIRGMSKVVASGMTIRADVFQTLVDVLPQHFGGSATDYQFVESHRDGRSRLALRIDPRLGRIEDEIALGIVREALRDTEVGRLADDVWSAEGALRVERVAPVRTRVGKVLALEALR